MGTWPGARLCELSAGGGPPASWPDPVARYPCTRVGVLPFAGGGLPDLVGPGAPTSPDGPVDGPVMASAAVRARPRQRGAVQGSMKAPRPASAELFNGVDATRGNSHILGELDETLCGTKSRRSGALGPGVDPAEALPLDAHHVVGTVVVGDGGDVEVFPRRCRAQPRHGVHRRAVGLRAQHCAVGGGDRAPTAAMA